jgi:glycylpeptide N-tetradecanoyltransferase
VLPLARFRPQDDVVEAFVVENTTTGKLTDMLSFYSLPSQILGHKDYTLLRAAYMFYTVPGSVPISNLMNVRA